MGIYIYVIVCLYLRIPLDRDQSSSRQSLRTHTIGLCLGHVGDCSFRNIQSDSTAHNQIAIRYMQRSHWLVVIVLHMDWLERNEQTCYWSTMS